MSTMAAYKQDILKHLLAALRAGGPSRNVSLPCGLVLEAAGYDVSHLIQRLRSHRPDQLAAELVDNVPKVESDNSDPVAASSGDAPNEQPTEEDAALETGQDDATESEAVPEVAEIPETDQVQGPDIVPDPEPEQPEYKAVGATPDPETQGQPVAVSEESANEADDEPAQESEPEPETLKVEEIGLPPSIVAALKAGGLDTVDDLRAMDLTLIPGINVGKAEIIRNALERIAN